MQLIKLFRDELLVLRGRLGERKGRGGAVQGLDSVPASTRVNQPDTLESISQVEALGESRFGIVKNFSTPAPVRSTRKLLLFAL
jgi:hypothetical protein